MRYPRAHNIIILVFAAAWLIACEPTLDKSEYMKWVADYNNNLHARTVVSDFVFDLQYQPAEYLFLQREPEKNLSPEEQKTEISKISDLQYYILSINTTANTDVGRYGVSNVSELQQRQYYFSFEFQNDITLEEDGKILPCALFHFEKPPARDGSRIFVLGFENKNKTTSESKLVINSELFSSLPIKIKIEKSNIPQVAL